MSNGFFKDLKKGIAQGVEDIADGTYIKEQEEKQVIKKEQKKAKDRIKAEDARKEVEDLLGTNEDVLYAYSFMINKMIVTDKKLIFINNKVAKNKTYAMIPFNKITSYSLLKPSGLSVKGSLRIFTGGDTPALELESMFNDGMNEFCKILADRI